MGNYKKEINTPHPGYSQSESIAQSLLKKKIKINHTFWGVGVNKKLFRAGLARQKQKQKGLSSNAPL